MGLGVSFVEAVGLRVIGRDLVSSSSESGIESKLSTE